MSGLGDFLLQHITQGGLAAQDGPLRGLPAPARSVVAGVLNTIPGVGLATSPVTALALRYGVSPMAQQPQGRPANPAPAGVS